MGFNGSINWRILRALLPLCVAVPGVLGHDAAPPLIRFRLPLGVHTMPVFTGVSHVDLTVRDADRSAAWYERVLGMKVLGELPELATPGLAAHVVTIMNPATGMTFGLVQHNSGEDGEVSEFRVGLDHLSLAVASRDELEKWVEHLDGLRRAAVSDQRDAVRIGGRVSESAYIQLELLALASNFQHPGLDSQRTAAGSDPFASPLPSVEASASRHPRPPGPPSHPECKGGKQVSAARAPSPRGGGASACGRARRRPKRRPRRSVRAPLRLPERRAQ